MSLDIGVKVKDRYLVLSEISRGNTSVIYEATDTVTNLSVIIKKIFGAGRIPTVKQLVEEELIIIKEVSKHKNLVCIIDFHFYINDLYLIMEGLDGWISLEKLITLRNNTLLPDEIDLLILDMVPMLNHIHQHSVRHGDIKPQNIFFKPPSSTFTNWNRQIVQNTKLADFGSALHSRDYTNPRNTSKILNHPFISPELVRIIENNTVEKLSYKSDIWSFGATLLYLATGFQFFEATNNVKTNMEFLHYLNQAWAFEVDVLARMSQKQVEKWNFLSPSARFIIENCLKIDVSHRMGSNDLFASRPFNLLLQTFESNLLKTRSRSSSFSSESSPNYKMMRLQEENELLKKEIDDLKSQLSSLKKEI